MEFELDLEIDYSNLGVYGELFQDYSENSNVVETQQQKNDKEQERGSNKNPILTELPTNPFPQVEYQDDSFFSELSSDMEFSNQVPLSPSSPMTSFQNDFKHEIGQIEKKIKLKDDFYVDFQDNNISLFQQLPGNPQNGFFPTTYRNENPFVNNLHYDHAQNQYPIQFPIEIQINQAPTPFHQVPTPFEMQIKQAPIQNKRKREIDVCPRHRIVIVNATSNSIKAKYEDGRVESFLKKSSVAPTIQNKPLRNRFMKDFNKNNTDVLCLKSKHNCKCIDSLKKKDTMKNGHTLYIKKSALDLFLH